MPNEKDEPFLFPDDGDAEEISPEFIIGDATQVGSPAPAPQAKADPGARARPRATPPRKEPAPPAPPAATAPSAEPAPAPVAAAPAPVTPARAASPRPAFPLVPALLFLTFGFGAGFFAGRLWERQGAGPPPPPPVAKAVEEPAAPAEPPRAEEPRRTTKAVKGTKAARAARGSAPTAPTAGKGRLDLTAPADAEAFLDGRWIGKGSLRVDVTPGKHKIEVRLGKARVGERFEVGPNETWTYEVTPK